MTHSPKLDTVLMVEKQIVDQIKKADYPTRTELWKSLPKGMEYQTFKRILDYLEASNKIIYKEDKIVWVAAENPRLKQLFERSVKLR
jgi:response regulator of citrate/malate metabolism